ncbi:MAG: hypothetical protein BMS9Abin37_3205 [Acidobacteriota bacterium]|nr:MAG: hypothetical protein BMS9Abin37_3205 [Acidobacteriota bacterium]
MYLIAMFLGFTAGYYLSAVPDWLMFGSAETIEADELKERAGEALGDVANVWHSAASFRGPALRETRFRERRESATAPYPVCPVCQTFGKPTPPPPWLQPFDVVAKRLASALSSVSSSRRVER